MGAYSVEGIVLRHADYRENDRMLTLLTPRGRVDALSRGCKRPKSPLLPASEVFVLGNYELISGKNHTLVSACLLRDSFYDLRLDIDKLSCAAYMANICEATVQPDENAQRPFLLLARALGYKPRLNHCVVCGQAIEPGAGALFDIEQGGVVCPACADSMTRGAALKSDELAWLREALVRGVRGELPPSSAPLSLLQAYLESRIGKRIPRLMVRLD